MRIPTILTAALATLVLGVGCATVDDGVAAESSSQPLVRGTQDNGSEGAAVGSTSHRCPHFVDQDGDGVCDLRGSGDCAGRCGGGFVDQDGDGACDHAGKGGCGRGQGFSDQDGDGVCDHAGQGRCGHGPGFIDQDGDGACDHAGQGRGPRFVDQDGDGVCDHQQSRHQRPPSP